MSTILWTIYLIVMLFFVLWCAFDLIQVDKSLNQGKTRTCVYFMLAVIMAIWYMYFLH